MAGPCRRVNVKQMLRPIKFDSVVNNLQNKCDEFANASIFIDGR